MKVLLEMLIPQGSKTERLGKISNQLFEHWQAVRGECLVVFVGHYGVWLEEMRLP